MPTKDELRLLQVLPLDIKIRKTEQRIREWVNYFGVDGVFVSVSGKDSTVLRYIARRLFPEIRSCFCNTGLEYPEIQKFWRAQENVDIIRPAISFKDVLSLYGYPIISKDVSLAIRYARKGSDWAIKDFEGLNHDGSESPFKAGMYKKYKPLLNTDFLISNQCCAIMKEQPLYEYTKDTQRKAIIGTTAEESKRRENSWLKTGCNAFDSDRPTSKPLSFWREQDVLQFIAENNVEIPSVYGKVIYENGIYHTTGCDRTGCIFCMFGAHCRDDDRFLRLKETHPVQYNYCMGGGSYDGGVWKPTKEGLGMRHVIEELHKLYGKDFIKISEEQK